MSKVETKLTTLDINQNEMANEVTVKIGVLSKKEESHHHELVAGLAELDDLKSRLNASNRKIGHLEDTMSGEIMGASNASDKQFENMRQMMEERQLAIVKLQTSIQLIEDNSAKITTPDRPLGLALPHVAVGRPTLCGHFLSLRSSTRSLSLPKDHGGRVRHSQGGSWR